MKPEEKLRDDIRYWEEQEREATEILRYASVVLAGLREGLRRLGQNGRPQPEPANDTETLLAQPAVAVTPAPTVTSGSDAPPLHGDCGEQIMQAFANNSGEELIANELMDYLEKHGTAFSRGAVDYQLRALHGQGKIGRKKPERRGLKAVWAYYLPTDERPAAKEAGDGALIG